MQVNSKRTKRGYSKEQTQTSKESEERVCVRIYIYIKNQKRPVKGANTDF